MLESEHRMAARALAQSAVVWDNVFPLEPWCGNDYSSLQRSRQAGFHAVGLTLAGDNHDPAEALRRLGEARRVLRDQDDTLLLALTADDVLRAKESGKLAVLLQFEGTRCFDRNLDLVEVFYRLGVRQTLLAFNNANCVGGGCAEESDGGLTRFGRNFIGEMEKVGMLLDLSHTGHRTSMDAMGVATKPCVFSHSNVHALHSHFRNVKDDQIKACAALGGLVGVSGASIYLGVEQAMTESLFRHVDYLAQMIGPDYVGLGLDVVYNAAALSAYLSSRPDEWPMVREPNWRGVSYVMPEQLIDFVELLITHGYNSGAIRGILGANYLRIARQLWR